MIYCICLWNEQFFNSNIRKAMPNFEVMRFVVIKKLFLKLHLKNQTHTIIFTNRVYILFGACMYLCDFIYVTNTFTTNIWHEIFYLFEINCIGKLWSCPINFGCTIKNFCSILEGNHSHQHTRIRVQSFKRVNCLFNRLGLWN